MKASKLLFFLSSFLIINILTPYLFNANVFFVSADGKIQEINKDIEKKNKKKKIILISSIAAGLVMLAASILGIGNCIKRKNDRMKGYTYRIDTWPDNDIRRVGTEISQKASKRGLKETIVNFHKGKQEGPSDKTLKSYVFDEIKKSGVVFSERQISDMMYYVLSDVAVMEKHWRNFPEYLPSLHLKKDLKK
ncbi:early transcribed membrane protein [Plasmodium gallinaceum]|uniref:Early transcribed membrane protein n=1 Tax=Plasmodium gallinaceum TaxID=5849 RepID=A0A1J1GSK2_PLAGA|nr:early transcribed membrane protein [Plasmodium gallinaceum]CRG95248.1 early transcribed membrane protein [Plasmodium gallinaceum]